VEKTKGVEGEDARPKTPAAERILEAASELLYEEGIRAVSVDAIVERAGVAKVTLYKNFGSKDELIAAYLRVREERWRERLKESVERRGGAPKDRLLSTFDALEEWMEHESYRGCPFVNASIELANPSHPALEVVREEKRWMRGYFAHLAAEAGVEDPEELAEHLLMLHEGATVTAVMQTIGEPIGKAKRNAAALLATL
jgi:AcrR family transcriptional regulator